LCKKKVAKNARSNGSSALIVKLEITCVEIEQCCVCRLSLSKSINLYTYSTNETYTKKRENGEHTESVKLVGIMFPYGNNVSEWSECN
jgi:hypothetical protein